MKKILTILCITAGSFAFSQTTSGDIYLPDPIDTLEKEMTLEQAQQSFETTVIDAFKVGNSKKIAAYFRENVDLSILGKENLYSKSQAEQILQHFFETHKPESFKIIHKGNAKASEYFIGELIDTKKGKYRVTFNRKSINNKQVVTSLTIEQN